MEGDGGCEGRSCPAGAASHRCCPPVSASPTAPRPVVPARLRRTALLSKLRRGGPLQAAPPLLPLFPETRLLTPPCGTEQGVLPNDGRL